LSYNNELGLKEKEGEITNKVHESLENISDRTIKFVCKSLQVGLTKDTMIGPTKIISHNVKVDEASKAYDIFDKKEDATKIVFKP
jgi:threonine dehydrogenase-like Zn-dependent dehydrogenase